jgi:hypothetical protein
LIKSGHPGGQRGPFFKAFFALKQPSYLCALGIVFWSERIPAQQVQFRARADSQALNTLLSQGCAMITMPRVRSASSASGSIYCDDFKKLQISTITRMDRPVSLRHCATVCLSLHAIPIRASSDFSRHSTAPAPVQFLAPFFLAGDEPALHEQVHDGLFELAALVRLGQVAQRVDHEARARGGLEHLGLQLRRHGHRVCRAARDHA